CKQSWQSSASNGPKVRPSRSNGCNVASAAALRRAGRWLGPSAESNQLAVGWRRRLVGGVTGCCTIRRALKSAPQEEDSRQVASCGCRAAILRAGAAVLGTESDCLANRLQRRARTPQDARRVP